MLMLSDPTTNRLPVLPLPFPDYECLKHFFAHVPGFNAYDAAKWAQITERACYGDRAALARLDAAGFTLMVTTRL